MLVPGFSANVDSYSVFLQSLVTLHGIDGKTFTLKFDSNAFGDFDVI